jgi:hypothetical protein
MMWRSSLRRSHRVVALAAKYLSVGACHFRNRLCSAALNMRQTAAHRPRPCPRLHRLPLAWMVCLDAFDVAAVRHRKPSVVAISCFARCLQDSRHSVGLRTVQAEWAEWADCDAYEVVVAAGPCATGAARQSFRPQPQQSRPSLNHDWLSHLELLQQLRRDAPPLAVLAELVARAKKKQYFLKLQPVQVQQQIVPPAHSRRQSLRHNHRRIRPRNRPRPMPD